MHQMSLKNKCIFNGQLQEQRMRPIDADFAGLRSMIYANEYSTIRGW